MSTERCSREPWPGSGWRRIGPDAGAVAIRAFSPQHPDCLSRNPDGAVLLGRDAPLSCDDRSALAQGLPQEGAGQFLVPHQQQLAAYLLLHQPLPFRLEG